MLPAKAAAQAPSLSGCTQSETGIQAGVQIGGSARTCRAEPGHDAAVPAATQGCTRDLPKRGSSFRRSGVADRILVVIKREQVDLWKHGVGKILVGDT